MTGIFQTTNRLTMVSTFGDTALCGPVMMTTNIWSADFGHLLATNGEKVVLTFWDDANSNGVREAGETAANLTLPVTNHTNACSHRLSYGAFDSNENNIPDWWEVATGLAEYDGPHGEFDDTDGDSLINLHEFWAGCNPLVPDGSNTLLSVLARSIDDRIHERNPTNSLAMFDNYMTNGTNFMFNSNFWCEGVNFSCISVWNTSSFPHSHGGVLISPRHVLFAKHWYLGIGSGLYFVDTSANLHYRTIADIRHVPNVDLTVAALNMDMTNIVPAYVMNNDTSAYICSGRQLPVITIDQFKTAGVADIGDFMSMRNDFMPVYYSFGQSMQQQRKEFYVPVKDKDSGSQTFLLENNHLILIGIRKSYGTDSNVSKYVATIQMLMDEMVSGYNLQIKNFNQYCTATGE